MTCRIPEITVGILFSPLIRFRLNGSYTNKITGKSYSGEYEVFKEDGIYSIKKLSEKSYKETLQLPLQLTPDNYGQCDFDLPDVIIGINFHWERKEEQKFKGSLRIIDEGEHLTVINVLTLEDYLLSVISSEMNANSSTELLKAHAVISRSWLLAQKEKAKEIKGNYSSVITDNDNYIRWYDREDHTNFDVCADDHCQRYQGISRAYTPKVKEALNATAGEVLTYAGKICDARFSKCCGGVTEQFDTTWEPVNHPYLSKVYDSVQKFTDADLSRENEAQEWILSSPAVFCNTTDRTILSNVLNDYDQETHHFFRWEVNYTTEAISALVKKRLGIDFGVITNITPLVRGVSGRITKLKITGTLRTMNIGKELVIRKAFSESHLYSSAFIVEKTTGGYIFRGAGWGHGVGLCQIGAAVMGARGYSYREILAHYFKGSNIQKIY